jgi:pimeloyl-ACP methyl ester carboxylesterase
MTAAVTFGAASPTPAPCGGKIVFICASAICVMNDDGSNETQLTDDQLWCSHPSSSRDGSKIAFSAMPSVGGTDRKWDIYVMNADGSNRTRLTNNAVNDIDPSFNGDGSKIAFVSDRDGNGNSGIYVMNADGSNQTRLPTSGHDFEPSFNGDGSKIAFVSNRDQRDDGVLRIEIYVMNADGSSQTRLTNDPTFRNFEPSFSKDGNKIAFSSEHNGNYDIYIMNADGSNRTPRLVNAAGGGRPSFSVDGSKIAFKSNNQICIMNANDEPNVIPLTGGDSPSFGGCEGKSPLIFIPGIAGSVLKGDVNGLANHQFWPSIFPWDVQWLNLREGVPNLEAVDVVRNVQFDRADAKAAALAAGNSQTDVDSLFAILDLFDDRFHLWGTPQKEIYGRFIDHLTADDRYQEFALNGDRSRLTTNFDLGVDGNRPIPTLFPFPYDWRSSYDADLETLYTYIQNIRRLHGDAKVDVVAHSAGGLLLRAYVLKYGAEDINHVVTVGSPWWGAPKTLYRMLTGIFFELGGVKDIVDTINHSFVKRSLATFPGSYELLPSDYYLNNGGTPVMSENGWNINEEGSSYEVYTPDQYKALINVKTAEAEIGLVPADVPSKVDDVFHSPFQDDWHADDAIGVSGAKYLHICGRQYTPKTTVHVVARYETFLGFVLQNRPTFDQLSGEGDGVVPLLSAQRNPNPQNPNQFLAPGTLVGVVQGANEPDVEGSAEHVALMHHAQVWAMMDAFLQDQNIPDATALRRNGMMTGTTVPTQRVSITGNGYVRLRDSLGNENTRLGDIAAAKIPGLDVTYGGDDPWVDVDAQGDVDFTIQSGTSDNIIEVKVLQLAEDGTPLSLRRYHFDATEHLWQVHIPATNAASSEPVVSIDADNNGTYEDGEQIAASQSSGTGPVDNTAPTLAASYFQTTGSIVVTLTAQDDVTANPAIRYTINDGVLQNYQTPLSFPANGSAILKAFAEDSMGNRSALLTTTTPPAGPIPTPTAGLVGNVSTRLPVGAGDDALIEGFIIDGPAGSTKKIIVRAIGPSLIPFGIADALTNPTLEIHDASGTTVATNNDWKITQVGGLITSDQTSEINSTGVAPSDDRESAIIANLVPGSYTAVVRGVNNTTGTGVVDAYDLNGSSPAKLANIATRGLVQAGDKLMVAGFIVQNAPVRAVVRAIGPSLLAFGINNALQDTTLQLRDQNGMIVLENDNWQSDQKQELESTGLQPSHNLEAALVADIQPGLYTAQVRGKNDTSGIGVVQVYFLQ